MLWTSADLIRELKISKRTLQRRLAEGLPHFYIGSRLRFEPEVVTRWLVEPSGATERQAVLAPGDYRCRQCGFEGHLAKPIPAEQMICPCGSKQVERV